MNCSDCCCRHNLANRHVGWQEEVYVPVPGPDVEHYRQLLRHGISTIVNKLPAMRAGNSIGYWKLSWFQQIFSLATTDIEWWGFFVLAVDIRKIRWVPCAKIFSFCRMPSPDLTVLGSKPLRMALSGRWMPEVWSEEGPISKLSGRVLGEAISGNWAGSAERALSTRLQSVLSTAQQRQACIGFLSVGFYRRVPALSENCPQQKRLGFFSILLLQSQFFVNWDKFSSDLNGVYSHNRKVSIYATWLLVGQLRGYEAEIISMVPALSVQVPRHIPAYQSLGTVLRLPRGI